MGRESRLIAVFFIYFNLPISAVCVKRRKYLCVSKRVDAFVHPWNWIRVLDFYGIQLSIIDAKEKRSILFQREENWRRPICLFGFDDFL